MEEPPRAEATPPLGHHARSVVTEAMPMRFVDEVGAHLASALAIATTKALVREYGLFGLRRRAEEGHGWIHRFANTHARREKMNDINA